MTRPATGRAVVLPVAFEHHREPLGIGESAPRLSWRVATDAPGWRQAAYEIRVTGADLVRGHHFTSGRVASAASVLVPWPDADLGSRTQRAVSVRVWSTEDAAPTEWSEPATVETGLLQAGDWHARMISPDWTEDTSVDQPPVLFRTEFTARAQIARARLYVTAHGVFEAEINGARRRTRRARPRAGAATGTGCAITPTTSPT